MICRIYGQSRIYDIWYILLRFHQLLKRMPFRSMEIRFGWWNFWMSSSGDFIFDYPDINQPTRFSSIGFSYLPYLVNPGYVTVRFISTGRGWRPRLWGAWGKWPVGLHGWNYLNRTSFKKTVFFVGKGIQGSLKIPTQAIPSSGTNISHHLGKEYYLQMSLLEGIC